MKALPLRAPLFIFLASLVAGCGLIAGIKDRTLDEGSGGSSTSATTSSTTAITTSAGGAGGQSATASTGTSMGGGGSAPCPQQVLGVEMLVCNQGHPSSLVLDGSLLFWTSEDDGAVRSISTAGGVVTTIAKDQPGVCGLAVAGGAVYWRSSAGLVRRRSLATPSEPIEQVAANQGSSCVIAADSTRVYWVKVDPAPNSDVIRSAPHVDLQAQSDLVKQVAQIDSLDASDPDSVYWASKGKGKVYGALKSNGEITSIGTGTAPCAARVLGQFVYWTDSFSGDVFKVSLDGSAPTALAHMAKTPCAIAPHVNFVYWVDQLSNGSVNRIQDTLSADIEKLADTQNMPCSIAVDLDGTHVYWTTCLGGEVLRLSVQPLPT